MLHEVTSPSPPFSNSIKISIENLELARELGINPRIHNLDHIYGFHKSYCGGDEDKGVAKYYRIGRYSADLIKTIIDDVTRTKLALGEEWAPQRMLDFASGYGNTVRHMAAIFPNSKVTACDIHRDAIDFMTNVLNVESHISSAVPEHLAIPEQDVIFALSFFSHMPGGTYARWLYALAKQLAPGGVLIFTANGYVSFKLGVTPGVNVQKNGFGFRPASEQADLDGSQYGLSVSYPNWVLYTLSQLPELRLAHFQEGFWWAHQDVYVCVRE